MRMKGKLVWKLGAVVALIMTGAIALSGYISNLICAHYALNSARAFIRFNSESIIKGIGQLMMNRDIEGIEQMIAGVSRDSEVYGDIRLVADHTGQIAASRFGRQGRRFWLWKTASVRCVTTGRISAAPRLRSSTWSWSSLAGDGPCPWWRRSSTNRVAAARPVMCTPKIAHFGFPERRVFVAPRGCHGRRPPAAHSGDGADIPDPRPGGTVAHVPPASGPTHPPPH